MKKFILALAATLMVIAPVAAEAGNHHRRHGYDRHHYRDRDYRPYRGYDRYDRRGPYRYGYDRRRCSNGTTGTIVGGVAGALLGRSIDTHGDRTTGTVLGAGAGALAGRAIDRNCR